MQDQFTAYLNRLLAIVEEDRQRKLKFSPGLEGAFPANRLPYSEQTCPASPFLSPYDNWTAAAPDNDLSLNFAEARRQIACCGTDLSELMKLRRAIASKMHPDVVPPAFAREAEDLMKSLNASVVSARRQT